MSKLAVMAAVTLLMNLTEGQQDGVMAADPPSLPPASIGSQGEPIEVWGGEDAVTPPFTLAGGSHAIRWVATPGSTLGCFHGGFLRAVDGSYAQDFGGHGPGSGETLADAVMSGDYYLNVISGRGHWTMTIARR